MRAPRALVTAFLVALAAPMVSVAPLVAQNEPADAPATQLRITLDRVLGEHAFLSLEVMRTGVSGGPEYAAAADALDANSADVVGAIESVYGAEAANAFAQQWGNHIGFIVDYEQALATGDSTAADVADQQLRQYVTDFSRLLATAIPQLPEEAVHGLIAEHVDQLEQVAAVRSEQFGDAYPAMRQTYEHMFMIGDGLAISITSQYPDRFTGREFAFSPAADLRITIERLLAEHTELAALAMRATITSASDARSAVDALNANSDDLEAAIASVYGAEAGTAFGNLWREHTSLYVDYVTALHANDTASLSTARNGLRGYRSAFTDFLAGANPFLSAAEFESMVGQHTQHLLTQADAYDRGDFARAYEIGRAAFAHAGVMGASLAAAIADQYPQRFPNTAAKVSAPAGGGELAAAGLLLLVAALLATWALAWRQAAAPRVTSPRSGKARPRSRP